MEVIKAFLEQQPLMVMFLTIALGHLAGELNIKGFSLGVGAVLFVALAVGWLVPKAAPAPMIGTLGLALFFLYTVGIQYGGQFLLGLTSVAGRRANLLAIIGVVCAALVTLLIQKFTGIKLGYASACLPVPVPARRRCRPPSPRWVMMMPRSAIPSLIPLAWPGRFCCCISRFCCSSRKSTLPPPPAHAHWKSPCTTPIWSAKHWPRSPPPCPPMRKSSPCEPATTTSQQRPSWCASGRRCAVGGQQRQRVAASQRHPWRAHARRLIRDRTDLDYLRVFASRPGIVGRALGDLDVPGGPGVVITQLRRGDTNIMPNPDAVIEFGDRIGMLAQRDQFATLRKYFGDSIKGTAEFSYISIGLGMALGFFLLGAIQIPMPVIGKLAVGVCGVLIVALLLGIVRRTRGINWTMPLSANMVLRNLGLTLFLAQVGMSSGPKFAATIADTGLLMLGWCNRVAGVGAAGAAVGHICVQAALRRARRYCGGCLRQSGHPGLLQQTDAHRPA